MEWGIIKEFEGMRDSSVAGSQGWKRGIRVNVLCPGNIMTPVGDSLQSERGYANSCGRWSERTSKMIRNCEQYGRGRT